jgi:hypothetical protein
MGSTQFNFELHSALEPGWFDWRPSTINLPTINRFMGNTHGLSSVDNGHAPHVLRCRLQVRAPENARRARALRRPDFRLDSPEPMALPCGHKFLMSADPTVPVL